jgi:ubiquinone/menaquinone biosynthesis C-methylase UbiE
VLTVGTPGTLLHGRNRITRELLDSPSNLLDYGCGDARFASAIAEHLRIQVHACDISADAVSEAEGKHGVHPFLISEHRPRLPLEDGQLAAVTCCDVLEHMGEGERREALAEISRVLSDEGVLIVTTPHKGLFSFADPENLKFYAPRLHRIAFRALKGRKAYAQRYGTGRFGNFSDEARRHEHFSAGDLEAMLNDAGFEVDAVR